MVEKFSEYESQSYITEEGTYMFTVMSAELKDSSTGNQMVEVNVKAEEGSMRTWFSLQPNARWKYNNFIAACLKLTKEERKTYELDYETIHNQLIGCKFVGIVEEDVYTKPEKAMTEDGRFVERLVEKRTLRINRFEAAE